MYQLFYPQGALGSARPGRDDIGIRVVVGPLGDAFAVICLMTLGGTDPTGWTAKSLG